MSWISILVIVITVLIVVAIVGVYIYKKIKGIPTDECSSCHGGSKAMIKAYNKKYKTDIKINKKDQASK